MSVPSGTGATAGPQAARQLYDNARRAMAQLHVDAAADLLEQARAALPATPDAERAELDMRVAVTWSWVVLDRDGARAALDGLARLEQRAEAQGRPDLRALPVVQAGVVCARQGDMVAALSHLRRAVPLARTLPVDDRVRLLLNKGTIASQAGRWAEASADLGTASELAGSAGLEEFAFMARHNQGYVEYLRGDLPAALRLMQEADDSPIDIDRSVSRLDRARVLLEAGLVDDAATLLRQAIDGLRSVGMAPEQADAELDLARCELLRDRAAEAGALAAGVADRAAARGETAREIQARLVVLEAALAPVGVEPPVDAADLRDQAVAVSAAALDAGLPRLAWRADLLAGMADIRLGQLEDAAAELRRAAPLARSPHLATRTFVARVRLLLALARGDRSGAASIARGVRADVARAAGGMASLDLRTASGLHLGPIIGLDLARAATSPPWDLVQALERWRSATATVPMLRPPRSEDAAADWSRLRVLHDEVRSAPASAQAALHDEIAAVELRLRRSAWADTTPREGRGAGLNGLQRPRLDTALRARDAVAVSLLWVGPDLHALVLRAGRQVVHATVIGRDAALALRDRLAGDLAAAARLDPTPGSALLAAAVRGSLSASLAAIDDAVLGNCGLRDDDPSALVIVPTGVLATVPWGMLPSRVGRPTLVARSLGEWLEAAQLVRARVAAVAGRDVASGEDEVHDVVEAWGGEGVVSRLDSTPGAVVDAFAATDLVHIAAHGRHRRDNPLFSTVWLEGGSLFAHEFEGRARRVSQVVLSACSTGGATVRPGDEPLGFTSALLAYGVGTVVAPVSDVPDATARRTMALYHRRLAAGTEASVALAEAVTTAASEGHPLAGAFTCFGAPWTAAAG